MLTPYQFASNRPIEGVDMDGAEFLPAYIWLEKQIMGSNHFEKINEGFQGGVKDLVYSVAQVVHSLPGEMKRAFSEQFATIDPGIASKQNQAIVDRLANQAKGTWETAKELKKIAHDAAKGDDKAIGRAIFEGGLFFTPGGEEFKALTIETKELKALGESITVAKKTIRNSEGLEVTRFLVRNEDELLKVAENAAGGSLDNFVERKPNRWVGEFNGERLQIEWEPYGHTNTNEGPHVRIQKEVLKNGRPKWDNGEKYFIHGQETLFNKGKKGK